MFILKFVISISGSTTTSRGTTTTTKITISSTTTSRSLSTTEGYTEFEMQFIFIYNMQCSSLIMTILSL